MTTSNSSRLAAERSIVWGFDCADAPRQRLYCDRRRNVLAQRWPARIVSMPCGTVHCSVECYRWWARLLAACLRRSWAELPPDATLRVTAFGLDEKQITKAEGRFIGRLRRRGVRYAWFRQWQSPQHGRHLHLAVRTAGTKVDVGDIGDLWHASLGPAGNGTVYAAPIRNLIGLARYLAGDCAKRIVLPPPEIRYIFYPQRGFLVRPLHQLKREVREDWARQRQNRLCGIQIT